ncbi:MAG TPA: hypothetical protein VK638_18970 [Edaphobacter sp.]|jgi:hypothetical protein|nr:hypothetical protein [Edaphobacter sp.]
MTFLNIALGWFIGFAFGVGCALAVLYSTYKGGYRKSIDESLLSRSQRLIEELSPKRRHAFKEMRDSVAPG